MAIKKAGFKAKLMTGTYVLQSNRAKFNQFSVDPTCLLCNDDAEDSLPVEVSMFVGAPRPVYGKDQLYFD